jgi:thiamine-phosphate pyrophosphorylase
LGPQGFAVLARLAPHGVPVIGIGGISAANAPAVRAAGAVGVAVAAAVVQAPDPEAAARAFRP